MRTLNDIYLSPRRSCWVTPVLVFCLFWSAMAYALHSHHHDEGEVATTDVQCQVCLFATLTHSPVPDAGFIPHPVSLLISLCLVFGYTIYVSALRTVRHARAPPSIS